MEFPMARPATGEIGVVQYRARRRIECAGPRPKLLKAVGGCMAAFLVLVSCEDPGAVGASIQPGGPWETCDLDLAFLRSGGVARDGIPALTDPEFVSADPQDENSYLEAEDRVVGILVNGEPLAIPHNTLWWHEIVNLNRGEVQLAVTYCPLTGSSLVFDRSVVGGDEFGVSGLLWQNNLLMYNRRTNESLWPQMVGQARCGPQTGLILPRFPAIEMTWEGWRTLYPDTKVVSSSADVRKSWGVYPYGNYESLSNNDFLFPDAMPCPAGTLSPVSSPDGVLRDTPLCPDTRRPAKERVLGIPDLAGGGIAFPFGALADAGTLVAVHVEVEGERLVVFWRGDFQGAAAYRAAVDGRELSFSVKDGVIVDEETRTIWSLKGDGSGGGMDGAQLDSVTQAFVAFWGAWSAFHPFTDLWSGAGA